MVPAIERTVASRPPLAGMSGVLLPQNRVAADEIADAVAFLVPGDARFITAVHLSVDTGMQYY